MAKCIPEELRNSLEQSVEAEHADNRAKIEENIVTPKDPTIIKFLRKIGDYTPFHRELTIDEWNAMYGDKNKRKAKADLITLIMQDNPQLIDYMVEYIQNDIARPSIKMPKDAFKKDEVTGKIMPILENFPIAKLNKYYNELSQWSKAEGKDWNTFRFKRYHLSLGLPKRMQMKENSGAYAKMYRATDRHADAMASRIAKFWGPIDDIYKQMGELWSGRISPEYKEAWKKNLNLTDQDGEEWFHSVFSRMAHGQIIDISQSEYEASIGEKGSKIYKDGPGLYINTQWRPTGDKYKSTEDAVYRWQVPVKFDGYDPEIHGTIEAMKLIDHLGRPRRDLLDFIQKSIPIDKNMKADIINMVDRFRLINEKAYNHINKELSNEFNNLLLTIGKFFPELNKVEISKLFMDEDTSVFDKLDDKTRKQYELEYNFLEENFTQYTLAEPFFRDSVTFEAKENHFPTKYHTGEYPHMLSEAIASSKANIESLKEQPWDTQKEKNTLDTKIKNLEKSVFNMERTMNTILDMPVDLETDGKMVTRREAKYGKHISNAFDMLKMRTDAQVPYDYLKDNMALIERNILVRQLLESFLLTKSEAVKQANIALYKRTIGFPDARGNIFGIEFSNEDIPESARIFMRSMRDYWMMKISGPTTAFINQFGHIQKVIEVGIKETLISWDKRKEYLDSNDISPKYKKFVLDAGVTQFEDFFTHSLVQDLEQVEMKREDAIQISKDINLYYYNREYRGMSKKGAGDILNESLEETFGRAIDTGAILSKEQNKALSKKEKRRKIRSMTSKMVNYAISKEYSMRRALREAPNSIKNVLLKQKWTFQIFEMYAKWLKTNLSSFVMSNTEATLRETSLIIGVNGAQSKGLIRDKDGNVVNKPFYDLDIGSIERKEAIKYGRMMTRTVMDFGMSKNDVGEMHATVLGNLLAQFAVWNQQKMDADENLYKAAWRSVRDGRSAPAAIKEMISQLRRFRKYPQSELRTSNPDMANLRSFLATQGIITLVMDLFLSNAALFQTPWIRQIGYNVGISKMGGATSNVQSWINLVGILLIRALTDNWWEDEEEVEQTIGYYARKTPLGLLWGTGIDLASMAVFWFNEKIRSKKIQSLMGTAIPPQVPPIVYKGTAKAISEELGPY